LQVFQRQFPVFWEHPAVAGSPRGDSATVRFRKVISAYFLERCVRAP
jgi:hypothetical protein